MAQAIIYNPQGENTVGHDEDESSWGSDWFPSIYNAAWTGPNTAIGSRKGFFLGHHPDGSGGKESYLEINAGEIGGFQVYGYKMEVSNGGVGIILDADTPKIVVGDFDGERLVLSGASNSLSFYEDGNGTAVLSIQGGFYNNTSGIKLTNGVVYSICNDPGGSYTGYLALYTDDNQNVAQDFIGIAIAGQSSIHELRRTSGLKGILVDIVNDAPGTDGAIEKHYGVYSKIESSVDSQEVVGLYGSAVNVGKGGLAYAGYFANGGVLVENNLYFGAGADTHLYRSAANTLKTPDAFDANSILIAGTESFDSSGYQKSGAKVRQALQFGYLSTINVTVGSSSTADAKTIDGVANDYGYKIDIAGKIVAMTVQGKKGGHPGDGSGNLKATVQVNGSNNTDLQTTISVDNVAGNISGIDTADITFTAGDAINVEITLTETGGIGGEISVNNLSIIVWVKT